MNNPQILLLALAICAAPSVTNAAVTFSGTAMPVITEQPPASTGLNDIFVIDNIRGVTAQYSASGSNVVKWYRYSAMGGGYAEEVAATQDGNVSTLANLEGNMGYIVEDGTSRYYFWVVNYANSPLFLSGMEISDESDCANVVLTTTGRGDKITYYSINGAPQTLSRDIELSYTTLVWDSESLSYRETETVTTYPYLSAIIHAPAPLCNTSFHLSGDKFLKAWGLLEETNDVDYAATAVSAHTSAEQTVREVDNEKDAGSSGSLGGSAPCEISFSATATDAAIFHEWQFATDPEFVNLTNRYNELDVTYTFREQGTTYIRFMASNAAGACDWYSETYQVNIGESALECPNAFSPGSTEGINDEWKVSYKSIISFECHIFNRWGQKMAELTDPSQGWDGRYHGKLVPAGVYFYVIQATGSDGKEYKLNGDINIINFNDKRRTSSDVQQ